MDPVAESVEPLREELELDEPLSVTVREPSLDMVTDLLTPKSTLAATSLVETPQLSSWLQSKPRLCIASLESSMNLASM